LERLGTGERLLRARRSRMWTQGRLAAEAGVSPTTVSGIETGRIPSPHFGTVRKLARALDVDPSGLLSAGEPPGRERHDSLTLGWARSIQEEEFEQGLEEASLKRLEALRRALDEERGRLQALYGEFPEGSEQRRYIKRQIRIVAAQSGSVATSMMFREGDGNLGRADADGTSAG
jgi:transcriptional regulator with XRE-family HTH domain